MGKALKRNKSILILTPPDILSRNKCGYTKNDGIWIILNGRLIRNCWKEV